MAKFPLDFLLSFGASTGASGLAGLIGALRQAQLNQQQSAQDSILRARSDKQIKDLQNPDYQGIIDAMTRNLTSALQTQGANNAASGLSTNSRAGTRASGVAKARENQISADANAQLAQYILQDKLQRQSQISQILNSSYYRTPQAGNPAIDAFLGLLGGAATGATNSIDSAIASGIFGNKSGNSTNILPGVDQNPNVVAMNPVDQLKSYGIDPSYLSFLSNSGLLNGLVG